MSEHVFTYATVAEPEQRREVCVPSGASYSTVHAILAQRVGDLATFRYARTATADDAALPFVSSPPPPRAAPAHTPPTGVRTAASTPARPAPAHAPSPATAPAVSAGPAASWDAAFARLDSEHEADEHEQDGSTERAPRPWDEVFDDLDAAHDREDTADVDAWRRAFDTAGTPSALRPGR